MVFRPPRAGTIRLDLAAFRNACADIRETWESYDDYQRHCWLKIHSTYRSWLRAELFDRRDDYLLKEPESDGRS
ncbi:hypothetical protein [Afipia sp. P52-10]|uniref:hypothetical protein n=1 Tax=Afipia sp. P52-10 TaxID=1429916 RepID=UPI001FCAE267|nr:hypothetical protein [Afipia sp. P52-10]